MLTDRAPSSARNDDLDLRLVRYFVAVAEHSNFGRAAEELRIAQPSLSRQVRRLESLLGARLLKRSSRGTALTDAGHAYLPHARALLVAADRAGEAARHAAAASRFVVGHVGGISASAAARALRLAFPGLQVRTREVEDFAVADALREGAIDGALARSPLDPTGLRVRVLREEQRVLVVAPDHPLARRPWVAPDDFAGEARPSCGATDGSWTMFWRGEVQDGARSAAILPVAVESFGDKLDLVAAGEVVTMLAAGDARLAARTDVVAVPVRGLAPIELLGAVRALDVDLVGRTFLDGLKAEPTTLSATAS